MRRTALRIGAELIPLLLVFASLAIALGLIVQAHRRSLVPKVAKSPEPAAVEPMVVESKPVPAPAPSVILPPDPEPQPEPVDPTEAALAEIRTHLDEQKAEAAKSDAEAERLEAARKALAERTEGWKRREMLAKDQLDKVDQAVTTLEQQADVLARMRDVLAAKRDEEKTDLAVAQTKSGVAILPYKGANGTWRLPIVIECRNGMATLQPTGPSFSLVELSGIFSSRTSPIARAVALRLMQLQNIESPDGQAVVPYLLFVIRPDGIRPYYEARSRLEPLGITFGYELVDSETEIDFPDLADISEWSETPARKKPEAIAGEFVWPADRQGFDGKKDKDSEYVWPTTQPTGAGDIHGQKQAGRAPFDPLAKPGIEPYGGPKHSLDSMLGSGGHPAMPRRFEDGGLNRGVDPGLGQKPSKPGRVELTPEDLMAAVEEQLHGPSPVGYDSGGGMNAEDGGGLDPLAEPAAPAPFPSGFGQKGSPGNGIAGRPPGGYPASPSRAMPGRPGSAHPGEGSSPVIGSLGRYAGGSEPIPQARGSGSTENPTIGSYGAAFSPMEGMPPGASGSNGGSGEPNQNAASNSSSLNGMPTGAGSGGGQGQGTQGAASPGLVNMSLSGGGSHGPEAENNGQKQAQKPGETASTGSGGDGDGKGAGMASTEAYQKRRNLEMVIACGPGGLTVHPGGYRITQASLDADGGMLDKVLHGIVRNHEKKDPKSEWMPRLKYLIEPGGQTVYAKARKQNITGASGWPAHLKFSEGSPLKIAVEEKNTR